MLLNELELLQKKINALKSKLEAASDEKEYKDIRLTLDYNELQIEKLRKKIEKHNEDKTTAHAESDALDKEIDILNCILDHYNLLNEIKNFEDRKTRVVTRVEKILSERADLYTMRINLNKRWNDLTKEEELPKKRITVFGQDKPIKPEELCEALCLKASAKIYFI